MLSKPIFKKFTARLASSYLAALLAVGFVSDLRAADSSVAAPKLNSVKPGDTTIKGTAAPNMQVVLTRLHKNGAVDSMVTTADKNGQFSQQVSTTGHDTMAAGDSVSASYVITPLPAVTSIESTKADGTPAVIHFQSDIDQSQKNGDPISFVVGYSGPFTGWPSGFIGTHSGKVTDRQTITLNMGDTLTVPDGAPVTNLVLVVPQSPTASVTVTTPLCDLGRFRCYAYFGGTFSGDFSKQDPYLDFNVEQSWIKKDRTIVGTIYDVRLTQIPTTSTSASSSSNSSSGSASSGSGSSGSNQGTGSSGSNQTNGSGSSSNSQQSAASAFTTAAKSIQVQGGVYYAPYIPPHLVWTYDHNQYGAIPSLLFKGGGRGSVDGVVSQSQLAFPNQDKAFFTNYGGGFRFAFVQWHAVQSESHETLSYVDFTFGKDRLYDFVGPDFGPATSGGGLSNVRHYGLRKMVEARLKIPKVDVQVGTDLNLGQGQNEVRIVVTTNAISIFRTLAGVQ